MTSLLGEIFYSWKDITEKGPLASETFQSWLPGLMNALSVVLWVFLALVGAAGGIYAIYVGIKMARADSAEQRDENKKRMINIIVSIVVVIVLIIFFNVFLPMILSAAMGVKYDEFEGENNQGVQGGSVQAALTAAKVLLRLPL